MESTFAACVAFKPLADRMMWLFYHACLASEAKWEQAHKGGTTRAVLEWLWQRFGEKHDFATYLKLTAGISDLL